MKRLLLATALFAIAQLHYFWSEPPGPVPLSFGGYVALSFGALFFLAAGAYLPQLLRRAVPAVELEVGSIEVGIDWRFRFER